MDEKLTIIDRDYIKLAQLSPGALAEKIRREFHGDSSVDFASQKKFCAKLHLSFAHRYRKNMLAWMQLIDEEEFLKSFGDDAHV